MRIGSLFSGVGGLELGLEWSGLGHTVWQVEIEPHNRAVLAQHWPHVERFEDVQLMGSAALAPVDVVCGGFPCQDVSSAGSRKGLAGERSGLWREFARIVGELRPRWVVVENVTSGAALWVDAVCRSLGQRGYETLPVPMQADWVGAPYPRARVFIVARLADHDRDVQPARSVDAEMASSPTPGGVAPRARQAPHPHSEQLRQQPGRVGRAHGQGPQVAPVHRWSEPMPPVDGVVPRPPGQVAFQRMAGNCVVPQCAEVIGHMIQDLEAA